MTDENRTFLLFPDDGDDLTEWDEASDLTIQNEQLEEILSEERALELERELEQDENPRDYTVELEDEEEEAAPVSEKRLKRQIRAEALARLEDAARTEDDFRYVVSEWDRLDRNRERRERDHEHLRGDVPLEYMAVPNPKMIPLYLNLPRYRQLASGNFLDIIFSCPYELHELVASSFISELIRSLTIDQKEVLYYLSIRQYSTIQVGMIRGQTDRNIRKLRKNIHKKLQRAVYDYLLEKQNDCGSLTLRERQFLEEYGLLLKAYGKDAVILRENKSKPRKKKAALGSSKDSE